ncbi:hypothetical protein DPMN_078005 [Dreissena polymorpha]|uniref:Uncharacterized protein n=1 Tax=Dreissena polymorpha TaxID=45954 RepID=A0A9D4BRT7_DREPO|nr:hypothetical protein DPMN_078005 [Dreissena polymorpha]
MAHRPCVVQCEYLMAHRRAWFSVTTDGPQNRACVQCDYLMAHKTCVVQWTT